MNLKALLKNISPAKKRFLKFAMIGTIGFIVDSLAFGCFFRLLKLPIYIARALAFVPAVSTTWLLNRRLTFSDRSRPRRKRHEYLGYMMVNLAGTTINFLTFIAAVEFVPSLKQIAIIPLVLGSLSGLLFNYNLSKLLVYKRK
jgi:putative flippase GtrA